MDKVAKRRRDSQPLHKDQSVPDAATASAAQLQLLTQLTAPQQTYKADFSGYWGGRRNGWSPHVLIFSARTETSRAPDRSASGDCFVYDKQTGSIRVVRDDVVLKIEVWWKGRAPWGWVTSPSHIE